MDEATTFRGTAQLFGHNWRVLAAALSPALISVGSMYLAGAPGGLAALAIVVGMLSLVAAPFVLLYAWFARPRPARKPVEIAADAAGLHW